MVRGILAQTGDVPAPRAVYGVLLNFKNELEALGDAVREPPYKAPPRAPVLYVKPANTWIGDGASIPLPAGESALQPGATLGLVFGRAATHVPAQQALDYVAGYCVVNDVRLPHKSFYRPAIKQLCRDGFCAIGPTVEREFDCNGVTIRCHVNGSLRQEMRAADLVRSIPRLIADITSFMTLGAGDVLLVGVAADRPDARAGDRVHVEIEGLGSIENSVVAQRPS
jgi:5-oxopent-3-ene-1,2,5-tricarboxylate decarboxylase / 2-hydroxyhepta-2,4-diene-1,7-dioate isomerase